MIGMADLHHFCTVLITSVLYIFVLIICLSYLATQLLVTN